MITIITIRVVHDKPGVVNHAMTRLRALVQMLFESVDVSAWEETR